MGLALWNLLAALEVVNQVLSDEVWTALGP